MSAMSGVFLNQFKSCQKMNHRPPARESQLKGPPAPRFAYLASTSARSPHQVQPRSSAPPGLAQAHPLAADASQLTLQGRSSDVELPHDEQSNRFARTTTVQKQCHSFAEEKQVIVAETIQAVGNAVRVAGVALEVAAFNIRKRQSWKAMSLGVGGSAADGESDDEDSVASTGSFPPLSLPVGKGSQEDDACTASTCSSPLWDMQEYSPRSEVSSRDGFGKTAQVPDLRGRTLASERFLLKERKRSQLKEDWGDSLLKKIDEIGPNVRPYVAQ